MIEMFVNNNACRLEHIPNTDIFIVAVGTQYCCRMFSSLCCNPNKVYCMGTIFSNYKILHH